ncbi:MAG: hypothetical protein IT258_20735 [Saprospiraceae bacterium]|nr:hypothetical protein [Saprospiraceae bacterium]
MKEFTVKAGNFAIIATNESTQLVLITETNPVEKKVKYLTDNKFYDSSSMQEIKGLIQRNELRFGCYLHQVCETDISNIKEILGNVPKRRFQRIMTTKTFF